MPGATPVLVHASGLGRRFGARVALEGVELELAPGQLLGLAGPNGSGKSTLLRLLAGLLRPSAGQARVLGRDPFAERAAVMAAGARFVFAPPALYDGLTAAEQTLHLARLSDRGVTRAQVGQVLERVGLAERSAEPVRGFSLGMRQRLALAQALLPGPSFLALDEPTEGLDPLAVLELRGVLRGLVAEGVGVILASHLLLELDELVDELLVLDEGRTLFQGSPAELRGELRELELEADDPPAAARTLEAAGHPARLEGGLLVLPAGGLDLEQARELLAAAGQRLLAFAPRRPSLEAALLARLRERSEARA